jgi:transposase
MGDAGAADRGVLLEGQDRTTGPAAHDVSHSLAASKRREVALCPGGLGPWSRAAQTFIRWARRGVWERLLGLSQEKGVQLGMTFLDGTSIRAHQKAAGARRKGALKLSEMYVRRLGDLVGAMAPRPV